MVKIKLFFFTVILFTIYFNTSIAYERYFNLSKFPQSIKISLEPKNSKKFIKTSMKAFFSTKDNTINFESNSWIKANFEIDGESYTGQIKRHGGQKDHLDPPFSSLKVRLTKNYKGLREFILFLEGSRDFEKEIFWTIVMEELGFLSPISFTTNVNFLDEKKTYLFQEKIGKEFLENFKIGDFPIVEYDERQMWNNYQSKIKNNEKIDWSNWTDSLIFYGKIENSRFIKDINAIKISQKAINQINYNFHLSENFNVYNEIQQSYSKHSLFGNNRKFVYNPIYNILTPIYYDGGNWNFKTENTNCELDKIQIKTRNLIKAFEIKYGSKLDKYLICTANDIFLKYSNLEWKKNKYKYFLNNQKVNFITNDGKKVILPNDCYGHIYIKSSKCKAEDNLDFDFVKVFYQDGKLFFLCSLEKKNNSLEDCKIIDKFETIKNKLSGNDDYQKVLIRKFNFKRGYYNTLDKSHTINLGIMNTKGKIQQNNYEIINNNNLNFNNIIMDKNKTYILNLTNRDNQKNNFEAIFQNHDARLIIIGHIKKSDKFHFKSNIDFNTVNSTLRYNENKLTGCITFLDVTFEGGEIVSENMFCEDSINLIRGEGEIDYLEINNSNFDAIDLDFSRTKINRIKVNNAGNDCIDVSFGNYNFKEIFLNNCGDKGVSVGERSIVKIEKLSVKNAITGIASKDSSKAHVTWSNIKNNKYCLSAYNKKPEFDGGEIKINHLICENSYKNIFMDDISKIIFEKEIIN